MSNQTEPAANVTALYRREQLLDAFERAWRSGQRPSLADTLQQVPVADQAGLLSELLLLEIHYRRQAGESPAAIEYTPLYPQFAAEIERCLQQPPTELPTQASRGSNVSTFLPLADKKPERSQVLPLTKGESGGDSPAPDTLGPYELLEKLGEGGMGAVYKARHRHLDKLVAIKVLPPRFPVE